jgi:hypothetical protein
MLLIVTKEPQADWKSFAKGKEYKILDRSGWLANRSISEEIALLPIEKIIFSEYYPTSKTVIQEDVINNLPALRYNNPEKGYYYVVGDVDRSNLLANEIEFYTLLKDEKELPSSLPRRSEIIVPDLMTGLSFVEQFDQDHEIFVYELPSNTFVDMYKLWPRLLPFLNDKDIEENLTRLVDWYFRSQEKDIKTFFRGGEDLFKAMIAEKKPWKKYPLVLMSPIEDLEKYRGKDDYSNLLLDYKDYKDVLNRAKSPRDIEWWTILHLCVGINSLLLLPLLRKAFPERKFLKADTSIHTWIVDDKGNNYDLYWPLIGIQNLSTAIFHKEIRQHVRLTNQPLDPCEE